VTSQRFVTGGSIDRLHPDTEMPFHCLGPSQLPGELEIITHLASLPGWARCQRPSRRISSSAWNRERSLHPPSECCCCWNEEEAEKQKRGVSQNANSEPQRQWGPLDNTTDRCSAIFGFWPALARDRSLVTVRQHRVWSGWHRSPIISVERWTTAPHSHRRLVVLTFHGGLACFFPFCLS